LLYDDFALGRSIVPPHAVCVRPTLMRWDPRAPLSLENCVVAEMKEVVRATWNIFAISEKSGSPEEVPSEEVPSDFSPPQDYVDALGDPIDGVQLCSNIAIQSPEEAWGVEAARVAQSRIAQARRFREWALE